MVDRYSRYEAVLVCLDAGGRGRGLLQAGHPGRASLCRPGGRAADSRRHRRRTAGRRSAGCRSRSTSKRRSCRSSRLPSGDPGVVERMLEVQAVISRTYALAHLGRHAARGFDLCATTHCQLFQPSRLQTSRWAPQAAEAVRRTAHSVLWYDAGPARALFHADCGGHTSNAVDVWGGAARPYLIGRADDGPAGEVHTSWRFEAARPAVLARAERRSADAHRRSSRRDSGARSRRGRPRGTDRAARHTGAHRSRRNAARGARRRPSEIARSRARGSTSARSGRCSSSKAAASATASASARPARSRAFERERSRRRSCSATSRDQSRRAEVITTELTELTEKLELTEKTKNLFLLRDLRFTLWLIPTSLRHCVDDDVDRELRVVFPLEPLVPPVVVPLAPVVLVAVEHADPPLVLSPRADSRARSRHPIRSARATSRAGLPRT